GCAAYLVIVNRPPPGARKHPGQRGTKKLPAPALPMTRPAPFAVFPSAPQALDAILSERSSHPLRFTQRSPRVRLRLRNRRLQGGPAVTRAPLPRPAGRHNPHSRQRRRSFRPGLEVLEDRTVPAVFNIANGDVTSPTGLIAAINTANGNGQANTI